MKHSGRQVKNGTCLNAGVVLKDDYNFHFYQPINSGDVHKWARIIIEIPPVLVKKN